MLVPACACEVTVIKLTFKCSSLFCSNCRLTDVPGDTQVTGGSDHSGQAALGSQEEGVCRCCWWAGGLVV